MCRQSTQLPLARPNSSITHMSNIYDADRPERFSISDLFKRPITNVFGENLTIFFLVSLQHRSGDIVPPAARFDGVPLHLVPGAGNKCGS